MPDTINSVTFLSKNLQQNTLQNFFSTDLAIRDLLFSLMIYTWLNIFNGIPLFLWRYHHESI